MSCEQAIVSGFMPKDVPLDAIPSKSLTQCSQSCCDDLNCGIYSYFPDLDVCFLFALPDQPIYIPFPSTKNMEKINGVRVETGTLMKRKISTWIPWIILIILVTMAFIGYR